MFGNDGSKKTAKTTKRRKLEARSKPRSKARRKRRTRTAAPPKPPAQEEQERLAQVLAPAEEEEESQALNLDPNRLIVGHERLKVLNWYSYLKATGSTTAGSCEQIAYALNLALLAVRRVCLGGDHVDAGAHGAMPIWYEPVVVLRE